MSLFSRAHDILAAKANEALDSAENPDEQLDYAYQEMLDYITRVRQALVEIATERKRLDIQGGTDEQRQELAGQQHKLEETLAQLEQRVSQFRQQKEVMKADYAVAQADDYGGTGDALLRAQDKLETMVARAGATEQLAQSGALDDAGGDATRTQEELAEAARSADVDSQLAALKAQLAAEQSPPELPAGDPGEADPAKEL
jgi:phage shock protein A